MVKEAKAAKVKNGERGLRRRTGGRPSVCAQHHRASTDHTKQKTKPPTWCYHPPITIHQLLLLVAQPRHNQQQVSIDPDLWRVPAHFRFLKLRITMMLPAAALLFLARGADAFMIAPSAASTKTSSLFARSRVSDPTGPTPDMEEEEMEVVRLEDIPEAQYDPDVRPIPHQPWRRGTTDGCEDPIDAEWRQEAENLMKKAADLVGGTVLDITWYLTQVIVHIDNDWEKVPRDYIKTRGPQIDVMEPKNPLFYDPDDPNPEPIYSDRDDGPLYVRDTEQEDEIKSKSYARAEDGEEDLGLDPTDVSLYAKEEGRVEEALRYAEEVETRYLREERPMEADHLKIDTAAVSTIAGAILDALETVEDRLRILDRHEVVLTSPGAPDVLETQRQFDEHRGWDVAVETRDPWESNRTIRGKLVDRNSMDIILNVKGRMVTIPQNFVSCVRLPAAQRKDDQEAYEEAEEEDIYE